jgi:hypothetical protein
MHFEQKVAEDAEKETKEWHKTGPQISLMTQIQLFSNRRHLRNLRMNLPPRFMAVEFGNEKSTRGERW